MKPFTLMFLFAVLSIGQLHAQNKETPSSTSDYLNNFSSLNDSIFRSEQPSKKAFREMEALGVKTVINFRRNRDDANKTKRTQLQLIRIPLKASEMTEADIIRVLKTIRGAEKPVLFHCWKGSDRTGVIAAAYRVVFEGWSKEKAIEEFRTPQFGHNERLYPNLVELIVHLDTEKVKRELGISE